MSTITNVTIDKAANIYFEGDVTSRSVTLEDGTHLTLGIMMPGEYEFNTQDAEKMEVTSGQLFVLLPEQTSWQEISGGQTFYVPSNSRFKVKVRTITDYCCSYLS
ncbi:pyrimidine/purine nucleoside phosphorylase [Neptunomonas marina]|uniref:Pyrimidine/purine nucleoside phosphorylase n=1 Tax=Neptunomonas marina TaxID=1815562 RepID=A0A437Q962_9GAMM|nr:pyrimidine/purine nucleoside phosphorylase [Neptunomonas marina]RVU31030.1 pyrimidine/purine nucleoside phosphorylase [Neptunomonas marina]